MYLDSLSTTRRGGRRDIITWMDTPRSFVNLSFWPLIRTSFQSFHSIKKTKKGYLINPITPDDANSPSIDPDARSEGCHNALVPLYCFPAVEGSSLTRSSSFGIDGGISVTRILLFSACNSAAYYLFSPEVWEEKLLWVLENWKTHNLPMWWRFETHDFDHGALDTLWIKNGSWHHSIAVIKS